MVDVKDCLTKFQALRPEIVIISARVGTGLGTQLPKVNQLLFQSSVLLPSSMLSRKSWLCLKDLPEIIGIR